ncbi:MAG: M23 family metallopeptidase [Microthrixaceae bacterium]
MSGHRHGSVWWASVALMLGLLLFCLGAVSTSEVHAADDPGVSAPRPTYRAPVQARVIDPFRVPEGPYGPGNRGLEYDTDLGQAVRSIGSGRVVFAGAVGGRLVISVDHPDGLRSSLVGMASIAVAVGDRVEIGTVVGRSGVRLHLGVRRGRVYLDPELLFAVRRRARLVPWRASGG